jgi:hypothetical protein
MADFVVPKKVEGIISFVRQDSAESSETVETSDENNNETTESLTSGFSCIEPGCCRVFQTYSGLESHILLGKHKLKLKKMLNI